MASVRRKNKRSFEIRVSDGSDINGKPIVHQMTWKPEPGMTDRQIEKELNRQVVKRAAPIGILPVQKALHASSNAVFHWIDRSHHILYAPFASAENVYAFIIPHFGQVFKQLIADTFLLNTRRRFG